MVYRVVHASSSNELETKVNEMIRKGWRPQGGMAIDSLGTSPSHIRWFQAMVQDEGE